MRTIAGVARIISSGDVSFTADSTGALHISKYFGSTFDGNLTVTRNMAGITEFFLAGQNQAITGDFNYINKHGGHSSMGTFGGVTLIGGKVNVDYESHVEYAPFGFSRIKNLTGGGIISIKNAGRTIMEMDTLLLESFSIVGVNGPAVSDIDRNFITTSTGFLFEDDPNHQNDVYFSRNTVRGPAVIRMKGEGVFFDTYSGRGENFYGANVTYEVVGEGEIRIGHYFPVHYFGNLTFASVEGINPFNDRIYFRGENNATFLHNGVEEGVLPGFRINKENDARLILSQPLVNTQKIEFFGGYIESSPTYPLIFGLGSSHEGMSDDSHVIGSVHKIGNTAFTFPLGTGSKLFQAAMSAPNDMNAHFSVQFLERNPATDGYDTQSKEEVITRVYHEGYWDIQRLSGENGVELTLGYQVPSGYVNDPSKLLVVHWDGSKWNDLGNGGTTGDNEIGTVSTMSSVNEFSPFTFASIEDANPLPVELISFQIGKESGSTVLNWVTSEEVNSAYFQIERSLNSSNWEVIGEVKAAGTSKYIRGYQYSDSDRIFAELIFYRLKMIDHDGSLTYSEIRSIAGELVGERLVYPNPATDHLKFDLAPEQLVELKIFNVAGIEHPVRTQVGDQGSILDVSQLREGIYILRVTTKSKAIHTLRFIIRR